MKIEYVAVLLIVFAIGIFYISTGVQESRAKIALIVIDGFTPDYFNHTPQLDEIRDNSQSFIINTVEPSITPAAHASIVSCQPPSVHNITDYQKSFSEKPFLFRWAEKNNIRVCTVYGKSYLNFFDNSYKHFYMSVASDAALSQISKNFATECDIVIALLPDTDRFGHAYGPLSESMTRELEKIDTNAADLADYMHSKGAKVIITSDHGMCPAPGGGGIHNVSEDCALKVPLILDKDLTVPEGIDKNNLSITDILPIICAYYNLDCTDECHA